MASTMQAASSQQQPPSSSGNSGGDQSAPSPMDMLVEDMKSENIETRINGMRNLITIARAMGPEKTVNDLIPFLVRDINDEDEVFFEIAEQISNLLECIGDLNNLSVIVPLFDVLFAVEENCVRDKAIDSFKKIVQQVDKKLVTEHLLPLVKNLADEQWFAKKLCACKLIAFMHPYLENESQLMLIDKFIKLTSEEMPLIRKTAVTSLAAITENLYALDTLLPEEVEKEYEAQSGLATSKNAFVLVKEIFPVITNLSTDELDMVRVLIIQEVSKIIQMTIANFSPEGQRQYMMPFVSKLMCDPSWKVRATCAEEMVNLQKILDPSIFSEFATQKFLDYLNDTDNEVVVRSTLFISDFVENLPSEARHDFIIQKLAPKIDQLINSGNIHIKTSLSKSIVSLSKHVSKAEVTEHLLTFYMALLRDHDSSITLATISQVCQSGSDSFSLMELSSTILDSISELIRDSNWRVRQDVVALLPNLLNSIGFEREETNELCMTCLQMLSDSVYAVRMSVVDTIEKLVELQGYKWAQTKLMPTITELQSSQNYLIRQVCVSAISAITRFLSNEELIELYELLKGLVNDKVPNVRLRIVRFYREKVHPALGQDSSDQAREVCQQVQSQVQRLTEDIDPDVRDYAQTFVQECFQ